MSEWAHIFIRAIIFITALFFMTKILGKKQISEISFFEYVSGITIGSIAGEVIMGLESNIGHGILAIGIFGIITVLMDYLSLKSKNVRDFIEGKGTILIKEGKILEDNLKNEKYTTDELSSMLRTKNVFNFADVEFAVLEPTGDLSVLLKRENRPLTPKDLNMNMPKDKVPQTVIMDGNIMNDPLAASGKTRDWLQNELEKIGVTLENVFYGQVDSYGELHVDIYDDKLKQPTPQTRPLLMAMLKKCQADLELFELETQNQDAKKMYKKNAQKLDQAIQKLEPYLNT